MEFKKTTLDKVEFKQRTKKEFLEVLAAIKGMGPKDALIFTEMRPAEQKNWAPRLAQWHKKGALPHAMSFRKTTDDMWCISIAEKK